MSSAIQVFLRDSSVPGVEAWNAAIRAEGFDLVLDPFDLRTENAYRPASLEGEETGFEWYISPTSELDELPGFPFKGHVGDSDLKAELCFTSQANEDVASSVAGAVLAKLTGGYYWDPETDRRFLQGDHAVEAARAIVRQWKSGGGFDAKSKPPERCPPIIAGQAPPIIPTAKPPPLPSGGPLVLAPKPAVVLPYRLWCGLFVAMYVGILIFEILTARGVIEPDLGLITGFLTKDDPAARAQAIADARENAFGGAVVAALGAIFYGFAAFVPRKPWGWIIGLIAIIGSFFPFIVTAAGMIPLLLSWVKPQTKSYFLKRS